MVDTVWREKLDYDDLPQNVIMSNGYTNIAEPKHREQILKYSPFLARHAEDIFKGALKNVTTQIPKDKLHLLNAASLASVVGTSAILSLKRLPNERVVISYNQMKEVHTAQLQITDFKFEFAGQDVAYFTQYYPDSAKRNCVVFTPCPSPVDVVGEILFLKECQTALELIRLKWIEMVFIKYGGNMPPTVLLPDNMPPAVYEKLKKMYRRGIENSVTILELPSSYFEDNKADIQKILKTWESGKVTFGDFITMHDHLMEDSPLPQMALTGKAESGALGGQAPQVNKQEEEDVYVDYRVYVQPLLDDFRLVFGQGVYKE